MGVARMRAGGVQGLMSTHLCSGPSKEASDLLFATNKQPVSGSRIRCSTEERLVRGPCRACFLVTKAILFLISSFKAFLSSSGFGDRVSPSCLGAHSFMFVLDV